MPSGRDAPRRGLLAVGSVKTNVGHLEAAAGIAGLIKVVLSLQHDRIPPHLHFQQMNPHIDWKGVPVDIPINGREWKPGTKPRLAGVSSFGFSGTNAHIILEEAPTPRQREPKTTARGVHVLTLSARSESALSALAADYATYLKKTESNVADLCYTASTGRAHLSERAVYLAGSREELQAKLSENASIRGRAESAPDVAFLFTGQGAQYAGMGHQLYETEPVFRQAIDACAAAVNDELQPGLIELLYGSATELLNDTCYTQPAGFALQYALAQLWNSWGVKPTAVLGHSVGEYAAACVAGMYSVEDGMRFITARGRLTGSLPHGEGAMAAVLAPEPRVSEAVARLHPFVAIAAYNGPESVVISGRLREVDQISDQFSAEGFQVERLRVSHAFHSPLMDGVAADFANSAVSSITFSEPRVMLLSTVLGGPAHLEQVGKPDYWRRQVRGSVRFHEAIQTLAAQGYTIFVEIGAGSTLLGMGQESIGKDGQLWAPSIRRSKADNQQMAETLAELYVRGVDVDWAAYEAGRMRRRIPLPTYPFERQRYWLDVRARRTATRRGARHAMLGSRTDAALPVYDGAIDLETAPWISDHRVVGSPIVPAAAYLEIALAAAEDALGTTRPSVADLHLKEALRIDPATGALRLQTVVIPEGNEASFRIFSRPETTESQWTLHATGRLLLAQNVASTDLASLRTRINKEKKVVSFYDGLLAKNIDLGNAARNIRRLWAGESEALSEIRLEGYESNAALLDSCFQTLGAAALFGLQRETNGTYVLQSVERFEQSKPLSGTIFTHARILSDETSSMTAELSVYDHAGNCIAIASGIRMALFAAAAAPAPRHWFYRVEWQEKPLAEQAASVAGKLATDEKRIATLNSQAAHLALINGLNDYDTLRPVMDRACSAYIISAFEKAGVRFEPGAALDTAAVRVIDKHQRLFQRLLAILSEDGIIRRNGDSWETLERPVFGAGSLACEELERSFPQFGAELTILRNCGNHLLEVLGGEADPLELLAPRGSFETLERLYIHSPAARVFNPAAREALQSALDAAPTDRTIRILEIGAGTGGTTTYLTPVLAGRNVEYVYTDVSPLFTARAQERFREYPFFRYSVFDVEQPLEAQGLAAGKFDIVIAANVLHATADLRRTVRNAGNLLRTSGLLLVIEGTQAERWVDLTFGMTEGWWKFEDTALRPNHALLTREKWLDLLSSEGYHPAIVEPSAHSQQVLMLAESPDRTEEMEHGCVTVSRPEEFSAATECDTLIFDATAGATAWDLITTLKAAASRPTPPRMWLLTANAQPVAAQQSVSPENAALWGIARTAVLEYPQFWGGVIDVEPGVHAARFVFGGEKETSVEVTDNIRSIDFDLSGISTTIIPENRSDVEVILDGKGSVEVWTEGDQIHIEYQREFFEQFGFFDNTELIVYVPEDYNRDMDIEVGSGNVEFNGKSNMSIDHLKWK